MHSPIRFGGCDAALRAPAASEAQNPCSLKSINAFVDAPNAAWLPNSASTASEWITPYDGENDRPAGYYVYATFFPIPDSPAPTGFIINGQLASDNPTVGICLGTPAGVSSRPLVSGQSFPVNPAGVGSRDSQQWWPPFSFTKGASPTGLRVEFFSTSSFQ
jgi:hypothetical protein